jgi:hypothetical protein
VKKQKEATSNPEEQFIETMMNLEPEISLESQESDSDKLKENI